jgi:hypothetical protein
MADNDTNIIWWIIGIIILLAVFSGTSNANPYDTCYDADPTQYTDMVCD